MDQVRLAARNMLAAALGFSACRAAVDAPIEKFDQFSHGFIVASVLAAVAVIASSLIGLRFVSKSRSDIPWAAYLVAFLAAISLAAYSFAARHRLPDSFSLNNLLFLSVAFEAVIVLDAIYASWKMHFRSDRLE